MKAFIKFLIQGAITAATVMVIWADLNFQVNGRVLSEISYTEFLQSIFILTTSVAFFINYLKQGSIKGLALLISGFFLVILIRESDFYFDQIMRKLWFITALVVTAITFVVYWPNRKSFNKEVAAFTAKPSYGMMVSGMLIVLIFSRLFGKGDFWEELMGQNYLRNVKDVVEEGTELLGYMLVLMATFDYTFCNKAVNSNKE